MITKKKQIKHIFHQRKKKQIKNKKQKNKTTHVLKCTQQKDIEFDNMGFKLYKLNTLKLHNLLSMSLYSN